MSGRYSQNRVFINPKTTKPSTWLGFEGLAVYNYLSG